METSLARSSCSGARQLKIPSVTVFYSAVSLLLLLFKPYSPLILPVALFLLLYLPGFRFCSLFLPQLNKIGFGLIFGLALQGLSILIAFGTLQKLPFDLATFLVLTAFAINLILDGASIRLKRLELLSLSYLSTLHAQELRSRYVRSSMMLFVLAMIIRLIYVSVNTSSIAQDAALYVNAADHLASGGTFYANIVNDVGASFPFEYQSGLIPHTFTWFLMAIVFSFTSPSFDSVKLFLSLIGALLVFPSYELSRQWFGRSAFFVPLIIAIDPVLTFYSVVPFGPEITSTLFSLAAIAALERIREKHGYSFLSTLPISVLAAAATLSWSSIYFVLYLLAFILGASIAIRLSLKNTLLCIGLSGILYLTLIFGLQLWLMGLPIFVIIALLVISMSKRFNEFVRFLGFGIAGILLAFQFELFRYYTYPQATLFPAQTGGSSQIITSEISKYFFANVLSANALTIAEVYRVTAFEVAGWSIILLGFVGVLFYRKLNWRLSTFPLFFLPLHALATILFQPPGSGLVGVGFSASRFFLGWLVCVIFIAGVGLKFILEYLQTIYLSESKMTLPSIASRMPRFAQSVMLIVILTTPIALDFTANGYQVYNPQGLTSLLVKLNVDQASQWIAGNTNASDTIIAASLANERIWAMATHRTFAGLYIPSKPTNQIDLNDTVDLAQRLDAKYLLIDPSIYDGLYPVIVPYYTSASADQIGTLIPIVNRALNPLNQSTFPALRLVYISPPPTVVVFKFVNTIVTVDWIDDSFTSNWSLKSEGNISNQSFVPTGSMLNFSAVFSSGAQSWLRYGRTLQPTQNTSSSRFLAIRFQIDVSNPNVRLVSWVQDVNGQGYWLPAEYSFTWQSTEYDLWNFVGQGVSLNRIDLEIFELSDQGYLPVRCYIDYVAFLSVS